MATTHKVEDITVETLSELETALDAIGVDDWILVQIHPVIEDPSNDMTYRCIFRK